MTGKIIVLNGASSAGKSTLARKLQASLPEPFWHYSIDHLRDSGVLPTDRIRDGDFSWPDLRPAFFNGFHHSLVSFAEYGNNLIVDHIIETQDWMDALVQLLSTFDVFFVGIHCSLEELERREGIRGDRPTGDARRDIDTVHVHAKYDLELDETQAAEQNVRTLITAWTNRSKPAAFTQMMRQRQD